MICKKCRKQKHWKCKNGPWTIGTHCFCQHRVVISPGYKTYLDHKYNQPGWVLEAQAHEYLDNRNRITTPTESEK